MSEPKYNIALGLVFALLQGGIMPVFGIFIAQLLFTLVNFDIFPYPTPFIPESYYDEWKH